MKFLATLTGLLLAAHAASAGCTLNTLPARGYGGFSTSTYGGTVTYQQAYQQVQQSVLAPACPPCCDDQAQLGALLARLQQPTYGASFAATSYYMPTYGTVGFRTFRADYPVQQRFELRGAGGYYAPVQLAPRPVYVPHPVAVPGPAHAAPRLGGGFGGSGGGGFRQLLGLAAIGAGGFGGASVGGPVGAIFGAVAGKAVADAITGGGSGGFGARRGRGR